MIHRLPLALIISAAILLSSNITFASEKPEEHGLQEWEGAGSNQVAKFAKVVITKDEWTELWKRAFDKTAPDVDFGKYAVACVFLGYAADWLYHIEFGDPYVRDNKIVIPYGLHKAKLLLRVPFEFKAGGQYRMKVFKKREGFEMVAEGPDVTDIRYFFKKKE